MSRRAYDIAECSYMCLPGVRPEMNRISFNTYASVDKVIKVVVDFTGVTVEKMTSSARATNVSDARFIMWYMLRKFTKMTYTDIGVMFERDHTSVMYGENRCRNLVDTEKEFREKVRFMETQLS